MEENVINMNENDIMENVKEDIKIMTLENLITNGIDNNIPIVIKYLGQEISANIRPINSVEQSEINNKFIAKKESIILNTVKKCLMKDDGSNYSLEELEKIPNGIIEKIYLEVRKISGMEDDEEEDMELVRELMGF